MESKDAIKKLRASVDQEIEIIIGNQSPTKFSFKNSSLQDMYQSTCQKCYASFYSYPVEYSLAIWLESFCTGQKNQELGCTERNKQRNKDTEKEIKPPKKWKINA